MTITINGNGYPIFEANQVLKYTDLNGLFNYLDAQHRLTRTHLIGIGIVCGLTVTVDSTISATSPAIQVSSGCGITSEGYLIHLGDTRLTHYQGAVPVPARLFAPTGANGTDGTDDAEPPPPHTVVELYSQSQPGDDRRLLSENLDGSERDQAAVEAFWADQVLVAVCEPEDEQRDSCLVDCDDRGKDRRFRTRFFLLPRTQAQETGDANLSAEQLLRQGYQIDAELDMESLFTQRQDFWQAFELRVQRFGYTQETHQGAADAIPVVRLAEIKTYDAFLQNYYDVCDRAIDAISAVLPNLFQLFSPFFSSFNPDSAQHFNTEDLSDQLKKHLQAIWSPTAEAEPDDAETTIVETQYAIQYFYAYLSDIVAAYQELIDVAFDLMDDCAPDCRRFPKFLMLGQLDDSLNGSSDDLMCAPASPYRSHFTQPPLYNGNAQRVKQVQHLYERLRQLCQDDAFYLLPVYDTPTKITPSKDRAVPLSQQAIPYYLNYPNLYRYWNYDACRKGISNRHPAYFYPRGAGIAVEATDDLLHRLDAYNFYRIEGHIGESKTSALTQIKAHQQRYNLAFDVITLKLSPTANFDDLTLSGQFDDLEADFGRLRDRFLKLWDKNEKTWSQNIFLNTLRRLFFSQDALSNLTESEVSNQILVRSQNADNLKWDLQVTDDTSSTGQYRLYIADALGNPIAQYAPTEGSNLINFSGLTDAEQIREQNRIASEISACLSLGKVTFDLRFQPGSTLAANILPRYQLVLSVDDEFTLPLSPAGGNVVTAPIRFISSDTFTIIPDTDNNPIISPSPFRDFETLYGLLRDLPPEGTNTIPPGNGDAAECLNYFEFKGLMEVYRQRLEQLKDQQLFHRYAELHPGMEHLGGVPKGGTFILVYVDGDDIIDDILATEGNPIFQQRTNAFNALVEFPISFLVLSQIQQIIFNRADIVVADFCLPYRCCGDTPTTNYVLEKPRPVVLLERAAFCPDDDTRYEFMLHPEGGTLKGEGSFQDEADGQYYFQPSRITGTIVSERMITFTYVVDGSYDTLTVALYPKPFGKLSLPGDEFCNDADPVDITLAAANQNPAIELSELTINGSVVDRLDPELYALNDDPESVTIVAQLRDNRTDCTNTIEQTVTVYPTPEADFSTNIVNVTANGIEVEVSNIRPEGDADGVDFAWEFFGGDPSSNPRNQPFQVFYPPQSEQATISLKVIRNQCTSTITRAIFDIVAFNILTNDGPTVPQGRFLRQDRIVDISDFNTGEEYFIEAVTFPGMVGSIEFRYTAPNGNTEGFDPINETQPIADRNVYRVMDWQPTVGTYVFWAQAFSGKSWTGTASESLEVRLQIIQDEDPIDPEELQALLNERREEHRNRLDELGEANDRFQRQSVFEQLASFLSDQQWTFEQYRTLVENLISIFNQPTPDLKVEAIQAFATITAAFFDVIATTSRVTIDFNDLRNVLINAQQGGLDPNLVREIWDIDPLQSLDSPFVLSRIEQLMKLLEDVS